MEAKEEIAQLRERFEVLLDQLEDSVKIWLFETMNRQAEQLVMGTNLDFNTEKNPAEKMEKSQTGHKKKKKVVKGGKKKQSVAGEITRVESRLSLAEHHNERQTDSSPGSPTLRRSSSLRKLENPKKEDRSPSPKAERPGDSLYWDDDCTSKSPSTRKSPLHRPQLTKDRAMHILGVGKKVDERGRPMVASTNYTQEDLDRAFKEKMYRTGQEDGPDRKTFLEAYQILKKGLELRTKFRMHARAADHAFSFATHLSSRKKLSNSTPQIQSEEYDADNQLETLEVELQEQPKEQMSGFKFKNLVNEKKGSFKAAMLMSSFKSNNAGIGAKFKNKSGKQKRT